MEPVPIVLIRLPIVLHVMLKPEHHAVNVIQIISLKRLRNVHYVQVSRSVKHVLKHQMHVRNVIMAIIQVEQDVLHVQQSQDALNVPRQPKRVRNVIVDIIYQVEHVQHVQVKWNNALNVPVMAVNVRNVIQDTIQMELHVLHVQR